MQTTTWTTLENVLSKLDIDNRSLYDIDPHAPSIQELSRHTQKDLTAVWG